ncbi:MAG: family 10 glycosylhydrolase, partial [Bacteroidales bacterium]
YGSHKAFYENPVLPIEQNLLQRILALAAKEAMEIHAWMWTMPNNNPAYIQEHPDWYVVNRAGQPAHTHPAYVGYYKFMCPNHPEVREFLRRNVSFLASIPGLAGVHLDYIRMPDAILAEALQPKYNLVQDKEYPEYDYCYCAHCREGFKALTGKDPLTDLPDPTTDPQWRQFRYDSVTSLVNEVLAPAIHAEGKKASAAVFPNWESVRQQWINWDLDAFFPMLYHNFYNADIQWIGHQISHFKSLLPASKQLHAGLFVPSLSPEDLIAAEVVAQQNGASGVSFFDYTAFTVDHWQKLSL